jgi:two-component system NtrC family response regulator
VARQHSRAPKRHRASCALARRGDREIRAQDLPLLTTAAMSRAAVGSATTLAELERQHIDAVLAQTNWHQGNAAKILGISSKTLYRKIREYGFERPKGGGDDANGRLSPRGTK